MIGTDYCAWCDEADAPRYRDGEGHDPACPLQPRGPRLRVVSDGTGAGTRIEVDGVDVTHALRVTRIEWALDADGRALAAMYVHPDSVELESPGLDLVRAEP